MSSEYYFLSTDNPLKVLNFVILWHFSRHIPHGAGELDGDLALFTYHAIDHWQSSGIVNIFLLSIRDPDFLFSCDVASVSDTYRPSIRQWFQR